MKSNSKEKISGSKEKKSGSKDEMTITSSHEIKPMKVDFDMTDKILETESEESSTVKDGELTLTYSKNEST